MLTGLDVNLPVASGEERVITESADSAGTCGFGSAVQPFTKQNQSLRSWRVGCTSQESKPRFGFLN